MSGTRVQEEKRSLLGILEKIWNFRKKILRKLSCILDDVAALLVSSGPLGLILMAAAGYVIFSMETYEACLGLYKAFQAKKPDYLKFFRELFFEKEAENREIDFDE